MYFWCSFHQGSWFILSSCHNGLGQNCVKTCFSKLTSSGHGWSWCWDCSISWLLGGFATWPTSGTSHLEHVKRWRHAERKEKKHVETHWTLKECRTRIVRAVLVRAVVLILQGLGGAEHRSTALGCISSMLCTLLFNHSHPFRSQWKQDVTCNSLEALQQALYSPLQRRYANNTRAWTCPHTGMHTKHHTDMQTCTWWLRDA